MNKEIHANHRKRMKEKFSFHGGSAFNDHELLEMLLYYSLPRVNTNPLAHRLLDTCGSLSGIFNTSIESLTEIEGVGKSTAEYLLIMGSIYKRLLAQSGNDSIVIENIKQACEIILPNLSNQTEEKLYILILDKNNVLRYKGFLGEGGVSSIDFFAKEIGDKCMAFGGQKYYIAHNHPSGITLPSQTDVKNSMLLEYTLTPMKLLMVDHLVCHNMDYTSFSELGVLLRQMRSPADIEKILDLKL